MSKNSLLIALFIGLFVLFTSISANCMEELTKASSKAFFSKQFDKPVVIMWSASWCPSCQASKPLVAQAEKLLPEVTFVEVDVDKLGSPPQVQFLPTWFVIDKTLKMKNGQTKLNVVKVIEGKPKTAEEFVKQIKASLEK